MRTPFPARFSSRGARVTRPGCLHLCRRPMVQQPQTIVSVRQRCRSLRASVRSGDVTDTTSPTRAAGVVSGTPGCASARRVRT
jgi:hypothetical protein